MEQIQPNNPLNGNGLVKLIIMGNSIRLKSVKRGKEAEAV